MYIWKIILKLSDVYFMTFDLTGQTPESFSFDCNHI